jgi:hypothetical protein
MRTTLIASLAGIALLSACHRGPDEEGSTLNNSINMSTNSEVMNEVAPPPPAVNATNAAKPAAPPKISEDQQMLDDADATGMTARLPNDENAAPVNAAAAAQ